MDKKNDPIDLGIYNFDREDPRSKQMLKKWVQSLQNDDLTYKPFDKKIVK